MARNGPQKHGSIAQNVRNPAGAKATSVVTKPDAPDGTWMPHSPEQRLTAVQGALLARSLRRALFPSSVFADSGWDILLALYAAALEDRQCSLDDLSSSGIAAKQLVPLIDVLEREGLVTTPYAASPVRIGLTSSGAGKMESFFSSPVGTAYC